MNDPHTFTAGLQCTLSDLRLSNAQHAIAHLENQESFQLSVDVNFSDTVDGNLVSLLMPLGLAIRVNFSARSSSGPGPEVDLGHTTLTTVADVYAYTPTLAIAGGPASIGLDPDTIYQIKAAVRVGYAPFSIPTLGRGFINGLDLPIGDPAEVPASEPEQPTPGKSPSGKTISEQLTDSKPAAAKARSPRNRSTKV